MMQSELEEKKLQYSLLSDKAILEHMEKGTVVITPFARDNLSTSSYDVTLGPYYYRERQLEFGSSVYNPFDKEMVDSIWGKVQKAELAADWCKRTGMKLENIRDDEMIIWIRPGETILAHTNEFIGGNTSVTTMMKSRSSMGRNFINCCSCAGWGDVDYISRWTMEISNSSKHYTIPLVVGRRTAQIIFFNTEGIVDKSYVSNGGKYQTTSDLDELKKNWSPESMLPKMYLDRECKKSLNIYNPKDYTFNGN